MCVIIFWGITEEWIIKKNVGPVSLNYSFDEVKNKNWENKIILGKIICGSWEFLFIHVYVCEQVFQCINLQRNIIL